MNQWVTNIRAEMEAIDVEVLEESALAMAQATIQNAINDAALSRAELARRMQCSRSLITRMLAGHNLTIKTMARALAACQMEVRFEKVPIEWTWAALPSSTDEVLAASVGNTSHADSWELGVRSIAQPYAA
jgi:hypothetical protein